MTKFSKSIFLEFKRKHDGYLGDNFRHQLCLYCMISTSLCLEAMTDLISPSVDD